jgi:hypothetical protein
VVFGEISFSQHAPWWRGNNLSQFIAIFCCLPVKWFVLIVVNPNIKNVRIAMNSSIPHSFIFADKLDLLLLRVIFK